MSKYNPTHKRHGLELVNQYAYSWMPRIPPFERAVVCVGKVWVRKGCKPIMRDLHAEERARNKILMDSLIVFFNDNKK